MIFLNGFLLHEIIIVIMWIFTIPLQISHFFLRPEADDFPRVLLTVTIAKPEVIFDVLVTCFEFNECCFVDFDGTFVREDIFATSGDKKDRSLTIIPLNVI